MALQADRAELAASVAVLPDVVSRAEEAGLERFASAAFAQRGLDYLRGPGWATGGCIDHYREYDQELAGWDEPGAAVLRRLREHLFDGP